MTNQAQQFLRFLFDFIVFILKEIRRNTMNFGTKIHIVELAKTAWYGLWLLETFDSNCFCSPQLPIRYAYVQMIFKNNINIVLRL